MAAPRVFISSTYYDLQHVRNDLRTFIQGLGYEAVMHDKGNIPYTQEVSLEESCYNELDTCDIVVCIIGNKFGTKSANGDYSITMTELQKAMKGRKKIYIYILKEVNAENFIYSANKAKDFTPYYADNIKIHEFITKLKDTVKNHPIIPFETVSDITNNLKQQFAGLFQHLLAQEAIVTESKTYEDLQDTAQSIRELVNKFSIEKESFFNKFSSTIYAMHPALKYLLGVLGGKQYELFAPNEKAIKQYLMDIGYTITEEDDSTLGNIICTKIEESHKYILRLDRNMFDADGCLIDVKERKKIENYISFKNELVPDDEDYLPF